MHFLCGLCQVNLCQWHYGEIYAIRVSTDIVVWRGGDSWIKVKFPPMGNRSSTWGNNFFPITFLYCCCVLHFIDDIHSACSITGYYRPHHYLPGIFSCSIMALGPEIFLWPCTVLPRALAPYFEGAFIVEPKLVEKRKFLKKYKRGTN